MTAVCIVQARIGSTRLRGKVLMEISGRPMLRHVLERCRAIPGIDEVVCAIPDSAENDVLVEAVRQTGAEVFRGSERDVLDRYWRAAAAVGATRVLRVTSDCPLIDPFLLGDMLRLQAETGADFVCNNMPASWPHGLDAELFTMAWLERSAREATEPADREHVGPYTRRHPEAHKVNLPCPRPDMAALRWTVDTAADMEFMRAVIPRLPPGPQGWNWLAPLALIEAEPALSLINQDG